MTVADEPDRSPEQALSRLAEACGIEPGFKNARGEAVVTAPDVQRKLLAAMGVKAETAQDVSASFDALRHTAAGTGLPPVVVARQEDGRCSVEFGTGDAASEV